MRSLAAIALVCLATAAAAQGTDTAKLVEDARGAALGMQKELLDFDARAAKGENPGAITIKRPL